MALDGRVQTGDVVNRRVDPVEVSHEHDHVAGRQLVLQSPHPAQAKHQRLRDVDQDVLSERVARLHLAALKIRPEGVFHDRRSSLDFVILVSQGTHGFYAGYRLVNPARNVIPESIVVFQVRFEVPRHPYRHQQVDQDGNQDDQRKFQVDREHHNKNGGGGEKLRPHFLGDGGVEGRHLVGLVDLPRDTACGTLRKKRERQPQNVPERIQDEALFHFIRGACGQEFGASGEEFCEHRSS